jgi:hypothetical protein
VSESFFNDLQEQDSSQACDSAGMRWDRKGFHLPGFIYNAPDETSSGFEIAGIMLICGCVGVDGRTTAGGANRPPGISAADTDSETTIEWEGGSKLADRRTVGLGRI